MVLRITTWNVNGIRNPFGYQPWRDKRSFAAMFDILEADIVVMQETKIQRKDLQDDMVLVPGWDCYFSLPKYKRGYSGVAIYTRQSVCAPIRAEEGITGVLCPPNSSTSYTNLPEEAQIGGYPSYSQLARFPVDAATLDSEGRCVILEFPAFVLIGVYSPANRDETRDDFRLGFINAFDDRVRNLIAQGKRVVLTGDLNISREEIDTANAEETMRKHGLGGEEYASTPARRLFNQFLFGGKVFGDRDEGREKPVMWDICRGFHEGRKGMFTCWEQKINARPGNFGSRIDYVLCSETMKDWFCESNIQEGLMGSDHCPVYAVLKDKVVVDNTDVDIRDVVNPLGMFVDGKRVMEYSTKSIPVLSGKLIPEFDRRRNIRDMFARKPSVSAEAPTVAEAGDAVDKALPTEEAVAIATNEHDSVINPISVEPVSAATISPKATGTGRPSSTTKASGVKRASDTATTRSLKRSKSGSSSAAPVAPAKGQQSLKGFFKAKPSTPNGESVLEADKESPVANAQGLERTVALTGVVAATLLPEEETPSASPIAVHRGSAVDENSIERPTQHSASQPLPLSPSAASKSGDVIDPIVSKESWSQLFSKPAAPRCEGHNEPCISLTTKKPGVNCGRVFWICPRPVGPTGNKKNGTQWRCETFIWSSQWNGSVS
ncbi:MAG: Class II abasic (AP) endonuclease [Candelina mexicana]|nr:MAG: Class II abasic (AP) endonuclease [Candelina mexicana]